MKGCRAVVQVLVTGLQMSWVRAWRVIMKELGVVYLEKISQLLHLL